MKYSGAPATYVPQELIIWPCQRRDVFLIVPSVWMNEESTCPVSCNRCDSAHLTHDRYGDGQIDQRLPAGMNLLMQAFKSFAGNVGIDLRAGQIGMPQHDLHAAQIGAVFQQMGRK